MRTPISILSRHVAALALLCALAAPTLADVISGRVVGVTDGDTITVLDDSKSQHRVRLQGIDAPESRQAFGARSKQNLSDLVFNKIVSVEWEKRDRYGRVLGKVLVGGRDACLEQVRAGMAWHYKHYQDDQSPEDRRLYSRAEEDAREARRGLWSDPDPVPPWDFRRGGRAPARATSEPGRGWPDAPQVDSQSLTVYVTRTGEKYHREGCQYLRRSRIPTSLGEAKKRYGPCSVCRPPK